MIRLVSSGCLLALVFLTAPSLSHAKIDTPSSWCLQGFPTNAKRDTLWRSVLKRHAYKGRFDYQGARKHSLARLRGYLCQLANTDPRRWSDRNARFAFWINAYNATVIRGVLRHLPTSRTGQKLFSTMSVKGFWKRKYKIAKRWLSLDHIENKILRPGFDDARLHFALASASIGGPYLLNEPFPDSVWISARLNIVARHYLRHPRGLKIDKAKKVVWLSKVFKWYRKDFAKAGTNSELKFVAEFASKPDVAWLKKHGKQATIKYTEFSWKLNATKAPASLRHNKIVEAFSKVLQKNVHKDKIDYKGIQRGGKRQLKAYLRWLRTVKVSILGRGDARKAFWLNAYNALVIASVLRHLPNSRTGQKLFSVMSVRGFWKKKHQVAGQRYSLNQLQQKILRPMGDPRTHFSLTSAAKGGAGISPRTYRSDRLQRQLDRGVRRYLRHPRGLKIDKAKKVVWLSKVFKWYRKDFAKAGKRSELKFVARYAPKAAAAWLKKHGKRATIKYIEFSWKLNLK